MILEDFFTIYVSFFDSNFFTGFLIFPITFGLLISIICLIWHIIRGY